MKYIRKYQSGDKVINPMIIRLDNSGKPISEYEYKRNKYIDNLRNTASAKGLSSFVANSPDYNTRLNRDIITDKYGVFKEKDLGNINLPENDVRRNVDPNSQWMYPNLSGEAKLQATNFTKELIGSFLPIPVLEQMGKIPGILNKTSSLVKKIIPGKNFKSEINWSNWNSEIPSIPGRVKEYNKIERAAKNKGTWMKNPDGTMYEGTPEQFIQEHSKAFKKAFPEGFDKMFRGNTYLTNTYKGKKPLAVFGAKDRNIAESYVNYQFPEYKNHNWFIRPETFNKPVEGLKIKNNPDKTYLTELITPRSKNDIIVEENSGFWRFLENKPYLNQEYVKRNTKRVAEEIKANPLWNNNKSGELVQQLREITKDAAERINRGELLASTDNYANYIMNNSNSPGKVIVKNIWDGGINPTDITIVNPYKVPIKSRWYNNGNFDLSNSNIFKSITGLTIGSNLINNSSKEMKYNKDKKLKFQQGGNVPQWDQKQLQLRNIWQRFLGIEPPYKDVNPQESVTRYMDNTLRGPIDISKIRKKIPYGSGFLESTRIIRHPGTNKADTSYIDPSGQKFDNEFIEKNPRFNSYLDKFGKYFKYQQGGTAQTAEKPSEQTYVDFAVRFLNAMGIPKDSMTNESGGLKDEYIEIVSSAIEEVDTPEFWEEYKTNPDETILGYLRSKQTPEEVELAKKGMKLKNLKNRKARKCKCGCDLVLKKGDGGTLVEVCSCGCKSK